MKLQSFLPVSIIIVSMQKVKMFLYSAKQSLLPKPLPYHTFSKISKVKSFWYFIGIVTVSYFFFLMAFVIIYRPYQSLDQLIEHVGESVNHIPSNLTIHVSDGMMITNYNHPYFAWIRLGSRPILAFVADDSAAPNKILIYRSLTLLTPRQFVVATPQDTFIAFPISQTIHLVINQTSVLSWYAQALQWYRTGILIASLLFFTSIPALFILTHLIYLFGISCVIYILYKFRREILPFGYIVKISAFAITTPLLLYYMGALLFPFLLAVPCVFVVGYCIFAFFAVHTAHRDHTHEKVHTYIHHHIHRT